jgi:predicted metalloprotease with PDZ domain
LGRKRIVLTGTQEYNVAGGVSTSQVGILDSFALGPFQWRNMKVAAAKENHIGLKFLSRFDVELDFPNRQAYFRPGRRLDEPECRDCVGISAKKVDGEWTIGGIVRNRAAEKTGVCPGDLMVRVNGMPASRLSAYELNDLFCQAGTELKLSLQRDGKIEEIALQLERPEDPFPACAELPSTMQEASKKQVSRSWWTRLGQRLRGSGKIN